MSKFFSNKYKDLKSYVPGEQPQDADYVKLNTNESPFDTSLKAAEYAALEAYKMRLYSDPECQSLVKEAAGYFGINENEIIFTNGSDEVLNFAVMAFCDENKGAAFADITYSFYPVICKLNNVDYMEIPLMDDFTLNIDDYAHLKRTIFIANPNAPTGIALKKKEIEEIIKLNPDSVVVVDEAYVDFGTESCIGLINKYDNLLVVQTFSKSRSLAGGRLGFAAGCKELINDLKTIKNSVNPYNVNRMTMAAGIGALEDDDYVEKNCEIIIKNREYVSEELKKIGFKMTNSKANFIFARHPEITGEKLYIELKKRGILVRHFAMPRIDEFIRITVGTENQMNIFLKEVKDIV